MTAPAAAAIPADVIVVGGGISGLLAALRHARTGARVVVLEAEAQVGGAVAAADVAGIRINTGAEAYSVASGAVDALLAELGLAEQVVSPAAGRGSRLVSDAGSLPSPGGGLLGIPARPLDPAVRRVLGWPGSLRAALDRWLPVGRGPADGVSIGAYVRRRMGGRVLQRLVAPVVGGVHSADPMTLELAAIQPRLPAAVREAGSLSGAVARLRPGAGRGGDATREDAATRGGGSGRRGGASPGTAVRSLSPTMAELPRALADAIRAADGSIVTGAEVLGIETERAPGRHRAETGPRRRVRTSENVYLADRLVLATAPDVSARLLAPSAPQLVAAIPSAPASPVRLVALVVDAPALDAAPSGTGALVAPGTRAVRAKALTHASAKWEHVADAACAAAQPGEHLHVVRLSYGRPGEELPPQSEATVDLALADASAILGVPLDREHLRGARIITWPQAMRTRAPGHRKALRALEELLAADPAAIGLELLGSWRDGTGLDAIAAAERERAGSPSDPAAPAADPSAASASASASAPPVSPSPAADPSADPAAPIALDRTPVPEGHDA